MWYDACFCFFGPVSEVFGDKQDCGRMRRERIEFEGVLLAFGLIDWHVMQKKKKLGGGKRG